MAISTGKTFRNLSTDSVVVVNNTEKRGRWNYVSFAPIAAPHASEELTEQRFEAAYAPCKDPRIKADSFNPHSIQAKALGIPVKTLAEQLTANTLGIPVKTLKTLDEMLVDEDVQAGREILQDGLTGFAKFRALHKSHRIETPEGKKRTQNNGDDVAEQLAALNLEGVYTLAANTLGVPVSILKTRYEHLNPGMQRMNLGNRIRKALRKDSK